MLVTKQLIIIIFLIEVNGYWLPSNVWWKRFLLKDTGLEQLKSE